jgi:hypothetical protein
MVFRRKPHRPTTTTTTSAPKSAPTPGDQPGRHRDQYVTRLEAMLVAEPHAPRLPLLSESEALVVVELLEHLIEQPVEDRISDLARTVIVRILDRVEHREAWSAS